MIVDQRGTVALRRVDELSVGIIGEIGAGRLTPLHEPFDAVNAPRETRDLDRGQSPLVGKGAHDEDVSQTPDDQDHANQLDP